MTTPPTHLPRRRQIRIMLAVGLGPLALLCFKVALFGPFGDAAPDRLPLSSAGAFALGGVFLLIAGVGFWVESVREASFDEEGVRLKAVNGTASLRWNEVEELWFQAGFLERSPSGGLVGHRVRVRFVGAGSMIELSDHDAGVLGAWQEAMRRIDPRLIERTLSSVRSGQRVVFGPKSVPSDGVTLSSTGLSFQRGREVPWTEITELCFRHGMLVARSPRSLLGHRKWVSEIPNLFVLTAAIKELAPRSVSLDLEPGVALASALTLGRERNGAKRG